MCYAASSKALVSFHGWQPYSTFFFERKSHIAQASQEFDMEQRVTLSFWLPTLHFPNAGMTSTNHHVWFSLVLELELRACCMLGKAFYQSGCICYSPIFVFMVFCFVSFSVLWLNMWLHACVTRSPSFYFYFLLKLNLLRRWWVLQ